MLGRRLRSHLASLRRSPRKATHGGLVQVIPASAGRSRSKSGRAPAPRSGRPVQVIYRFLLAGREGPPVRTRTANLGVGGAFLLTDRPAPPGTPLQLTLIWGRTTIEVRAEVRWVQQDLPSGMGVVFYGLDVDQLHWLGEFCARDARGVDGRQ